MRPLFLLLLSGLLFSPAAFAQSATDAPAKAAPTASAATATVPAEPAIPHYSPILPVKIHPRQEGADGISKAGADIEKANDLDADSLGLLTRASDGALNGDLWKSYSSAKLADDLSKLNLTIISPTMRALLIRALLTVPDAGSFTDAKDAKTNDAFSARLETLIDLGSYTDTVNLYKKLEGNIPSSKAALAGVEGLVGNGQMGLACLEEKAVGDNLKQASATTFWPDLKSFCQILLTTDTPEAQDDATSLIKAAQLYATSKKLTAPATLNELNARSVIEILAMDKAGLIPASLFTTDSARVLKPQVISLLLNQSPSAAVEKLSLLAAAVEKGLKTTDDLEAEYQVQSKMLTPALGTWQPILEAYSKITSTPDSAKPAQLKAILKSSEGWSETVFAPFARFFATNNAVDGFTQDEARRVLSLLIRAKTRVSGAWFAQAFNKPEAKTKESVTDLDVISALEGSSAAPAPAENAPEEDKRSGIQKTGPKTAETPETIENAQLHVISLILQSEEVEDKVPEKSYEKLLSLTGTNDYVMPTMELMNGLKQASASQDTGKVVLYSLQALNGQRVSQLHPAALFRITEGLQSVGLSEEIRSLAHEVLADLIEYKKVKKEN